MVERKPLDQVLEIALTDAGIQFERHKPVKGGMQPSYIEARVYYTINGKFDFYIVSPTSFYPMVVFDSLIIQRDFTLNGVQAMYDDIVMRAVAEIKRMVSLST
jgi:hypothetical protein